MSAATYLLWIDNEVVTVAGQILSHHATLDEAAWAYEGTVLRVAPKGRTPRVDRPTQAEPVAPAVYCELCFAVTNSIQKMQSGGYCKNCEREAARIRREYPGILLPTVTENGLVLS